MRFRRRHRLFPPLQLRLLLLVLHLLLLLLLPALFGLALLLPLLRLPLLAIPLLTVFLVASMKRLYTHYPLERWGDVRRLIRCTLPFLPKSELGRIGREDERSRIRSCSTTRLGGVWWCASAQLRCSYGSSSGSKFPYCQRNPNCVLSVAGPAPENARAVFYGVCHFSRMLYNYTSFNGRCVSLVQYPDYKLTDVQQRAPMVIRYGYGACEYNLGSLAYPRVAVGNSAGDKGWPTDLVKNGSAGSHAAAWDSPNGRILSVFGGLETNLMRNYHESWRVFTSMYLHGGFLHICINLLCQIQSLWMLEPVKSHVELRMSFARRT